MRIALVALAAAAGCWAPNYQSGRTRCDSVEPRCPSGFACVDVLGTCWRAEELPDLADFDGSELDQSLSGDGAVPPHVMVTVMFSGPGVHEDGSLPMAAILTGLWPGDSGQAVFSSAEGRFSGLACAPPAGDRGSCTVSFLPGVTGQAREVEVRAQSNDDGSVGKTVVHVEPPIQVGFTPPALDVLAFGTPEAATATAAVTHLLAGEDATVSLSVVGTASTAPSLSGAQVTVSPSPLPFPLASPSPAPVVVRALSVADPAKSADLRITVHAFVDESPALQAAIQAATGGTESVLFTGALAPSGDLLVAGELLGPSPSPRPLALARSAATGAWSVVLNGYLGQKGAVTGAAVDPGGGFVVVGVYGTATATGSQSMILARCRGTPPLCNDPTVPTLAVSGFSQLYYNQPGSWLTQTGNNLSQPATNNPHVVTFLSPGGLPSALVLSQTLSPSLCTAEQGPIVNASTAYFPLGTAGGTQSLQFVDEATTAPPDNSCPFSTTISDSRTWLGAAVNSGQKTLWLGGVDSCPPPTNCSLSGPYDGLVANSPATSGTWKTLSSVAGSSGVDGPVLQTGYDDSLLALNGYATISGQGNFLVYAPGWPPALLGSGSVPMASGTSDTGMAVAGAGRGGSAWSPSEAEIFYSINRYRSSGSITTLYVGRQRGLGAGSSTQLVQTWTSGPAGGLQVFDLQFSRIGSRVEGWAIGRVIPPGASPKYQPFVAHLQ